MRSYPELQTRILFWQQWLQSVAAYLTVQVLQTFNLGVKLNNKIIKISLQIHIFQNFKIHRFSDLPIFSHMGHYYCYELTIFHLFKSVNVIILLNSYLVLPS